MTCLCEQEREMMWIAGGQHALLAKRELLAEVEEELKKPDLSPEQVAKLEAEKKVWERNNVRVYDFPGNIIVTSQLNLTYFTYRHGGHSRHDGGQGARLPRQRRVLPYGRNLLRPVCC
jgi:hypothetical protein